MRKKVALIFKVFDKYSPLNLSTPKIKPFSTMMMIEWEQRSWLFSPWQSKEREKVTSGCCINVVENLGSRSYQGPCFSASTVFPLICTHFYRKKLMPPLILFHHVSLFLSHTHSHKHRVMI